METTLEGPSDYERIAAAIEFISRNHLLQPSLDDVAQGVGLSSFHFQRIFSRWVGVSPKKFLQFTTLTYARKILQTPGATLFDAAVDSGLSGTGRLHDLFIRFIAMTPGEYKNGGEQLHIRFNFLPSVFGEVLIARTDRGICHLTFEENRKCGLENLKTSFPNAVYRESNDPLFHDAIKMI
ncbi:MAG: AraC family transcriptional regulator, partial [Chitinophagaceae bacterium]